VIELSHSNRKKTIIRDYVVVLYEYNHPYL